MRETRPVNAEGGALGADIQRALERVSVPSYVLDTSGIVRWINPAAERIVGDVRGRHFTSVVAPEERRRAQELFSRKVLGTTAVTDTTGVFLSRHGGRVRLELSSVPLARGDRVVGVFGLLTESQHEEPVLPPPSQLTARQVEVLRLLEKGRSTRQIAAELHLTPETVRDHVRKIFRALGVHSRLEAVAAVRRA
jgi:PAS domain S-box-containing protein